MPDIIGRALSFPVIHGNLVRILLLGNSLRSDLRGYAFVFLPLIFQPLMQVFEVAVGLVRVLYKADLVAMIIVTSVAARSIV